MTLRLEIGRSYEPERRYAADVLLNHVLGLDVDIATGQDDAGFRFVDGVNGREVVVDDVLFRTHPERWLTEEVLPSEPLDSWTRPSVGGATPTLVRHELPVLYAGDADGGWVVDEGERLRLKLDVFGSAFFQVTRLEEAVRPDRDAHGRFPLAASLAHRAGFLDRPLVHEYGEVLWSCLRSVWPRLERRRRRFAVFSTHDVDAPFHHVNSSLAGVGRDVAHQLLRRRAPTMAAREVLDFAAVKRAGARRDPYNNFERIMDLCEAHGVRGAFYFIADPDPVGRVRRHIYTVEDQRVQAILRRIDERGHEIGIHASYRAHLDPVRLGDELRRLRAACSAVGSRQEVEGGRHHYLRWDVAGSFRSWVQAGLRYDCTLSFAERAGFRTGACCPYPAFDLFARCALPLVERPLVVMDVSLPPVPHRGAADAARAAREEILSLRRSCQLYDGEFVVLWHNSELAQPEQFSLFEAALSG